MSATERNDEILTLAEMADYLKVSQKTVLRMVQRGDLPGGKVSSRWRFQRTEGKATKRLLRV